MPQARPPDQPPASFEDEPIAWFAELLFARERGDFQRATAAHRQLVRLGWSVLPRKPRPARAEGTR